MNIELADGETRFRVCKWQSRVPDKIIFRNIEALTAHVHDENNISLSLSLLEIVVHACLCPPRDTTIDPRTFH